MIEIFSIGGVSRALLQDLACQLGRTYETDCKVSGKLEMPIAAYDSLRRQYRSDILLKHILNQRGMIAKNKVLAVTTLDLYSPPLNFVFGQAQCPGEVCVMSLHRLDPTFYGEPADRKLFLERTAKEAIHELGHTFGLGHCPNPKCVMSFSNSILDVDEKRSSLCRACRSRLGL